MSDKDVDLPAGLTPLYAGPEGHDAWVQPCSQRIAAAAVERWHYTRALAAVVTASFACFEHGRFVGVVVFGAGACPHLGKRFGLGNKETCELVRVAFRLHAQPVSRFVAAALSQLRRLVPRVRLVISFADTEQGHHGGIYQAGNWLYLGPAATQYYIVEGRRWHGRSLASKHGRGGQSIPWLREHVDPEAQRVQAPPKHRYAMPMDPAMRRRVASHAQPYPTRAGSGPEDTPADQAGEGGSTPTPALSSRPQPGVTRP